LRGVNRSAFFYRRGAGDRLYGGFWAGGRLFGGPCGELPFGLGGGMESYLGIGIVLFMAAIVLGTLVSDQTVKVKAYFSALGFYVLVGWYLSTTGFRAGVLNGIFLFILLFTVPFQIGGKFSRFRGGKRET
jgi:hypothetical protein